MTYLYVWPHSNPTLYGYGMTISTYATVLVDVSDAVATVTLNRPDQRNALSSQLIAELSEAMHALADDDSVRAIVLTGAGTAFSAGLDLRELGSSGDNLKLSGPSSGGERPWPLHHKPVIGAINGPAVTGALEIALHCDFLIAADTARFGDTHAQVGVLPGWGLSYLLPQAVGVRRAREMSLTGRLIGAEEALAWGLVNQVVPLARLVDHARAVAASAAELDPELSGEFLRLYRDNADTTLAEAAVLESDRSLAWARGTFDPRKVAERADGVIARGRAQG